MYFTYVCTYSTRNLFIHWGFYISTKYQFHSINIEMGYMILTSQETFKSYVQKLKLVSYYIYV